MKILVISLTLIIMSNTQIYSCQFIIKFISIEMDIFFVKHISQRCIGMSCKPRLLLNYNIHYLK